MKLSYDYSQKIHQLKNEIALHGLKLTDEIAIERGNKVDVPDVDYRPILRWHFSGQYPPDKDLELTNIGNLLIEMEEMNSII